MALDFTSLAAAVAKTGANQTVAKAAGGNYPAAGATRLRLVAYVEIGKQLTSYQGVDKVENQVTLVFELSGPKHPLYDLNGEMAPHRITVTTALSQNSKAKFYRLFTAMNKDHQVPHCVLLVGKAFLGTVVIRKYPKKGEPKEDQSKWTGVDAGLYNRDTGAFTVTGTAVNDPLSGETVVVPVDPPRSELRAFLWSSPSIEQWDSLFIDGEYPARTNDKGEVISPARPKNVFQNAIMRAENWKGSPIYQLLQAAGRSVAAAPPASKTLAEEASESVQERGAEKAPWEPAGDADTQDALGDIPL